MSWGRMERPTPVSICARSPDRSAQNIRPGTAVAVRLSNMPEVDATDARLLLALVEDPRASVMALSQRLGLARNTVQTRLARLESNGALAPLDRRGGPQGVGPPLGAPLPLPVG